MNDAKPPFGHGHLLIGGQQVEALEGGAFDDINPATEQVIGTAADGGPRDMDLAISAARKAFDETDWSTDRAFRRHCLLQLRDALEREKERLRKIVVAEVGAPVSLTHGPHLDQPIDDLARVIDMIDKFEWEQRSKP